MWNPFRRTTPEPITVDVHTGMIWRDRETGWWRYRCNNCDYGAGSSLRDAWRVTLPWLITLSHDHADPAHWSRRRR